MIYRVNTQQVGAAGTVIAVGGVILLVRLHADDLPDGWLTVVGIVYAVLMGLLMALILRSSTAITDAGVVVRHTWSSTEYPWPEVADIRFELVSGASGPTIHGAVLYDAQLRRVVLPYVNNRRLGGIPEAERATTELRERWAAARGADWQPRAAEVEQRVATRQGRSRVWAHALIALFSGFVLAIVIVVVVLLTASRAFMDTDVFSAMPLLILILPLLAFGTTAVVGLLRQRRP